MKKYFILVFIAFLIVGLFGCKKDELTTNQTYKYQTFNEPCLLWDSDAKAVKKWMSDKKWTIKNVEDNSDVEYVTYYNLLKEKETMLVFYKNPSSYTCADVFLVDGSIDDTELFGFILERYDQIDDGTITSYITKDKKTKVSLLLLQNIDNVVYNIVHYSPAE